jgi:hypothetical protein
VLQICVSGPTMPRVSLPTDDDDVPSSGTPKVSVGVTPSVTGVLAPSPLPLDIGGMLVNPSAVKNTNSHFGLNVHSMAARAHLSEDDRVKIFAKASAPLPNDVKFMTLSVSITDPKQLSELQDFDILIALARERMEHYDLTGVFNVSFPDPTGTLRMISPGKPSVVNLFSNYSKDEVCDVAASNRWIHENFDNSSEIHITSNGHMPFWPITWKRPYQTVSVASTIISLDQNKVFPCCSYSFSRTYFMLPNRQLKTYTPNSSAFVSTVFLEKRENCLNSYLLCRTTHLVHIGRSIPK